MDIFIVLLDFKVDFFEKLLKNEANIANMTIIKSKIFIKPIFIGLLTEI